MGLPTADALLQKAGVTDVANTHRMKIGSSAAVVQAVINGCTHGAR